MYLLTSTRIPVEKGVSCLASLQGPAKSLSLFVSFTCEFYFQPFPYPSGFIFLFLVETSISTFSTLGISFCYLQTLTNWHL